MRIQTLVTVYHDKVEYAPGTIVEMEDKAGRRLIRLKAAILAEDKISEASTSALEEAVEELCKIDGIDEAVAYRLIEAGFESIQSVAEAVVEDLTAIKGIGSKTVVTIQESAEDLLPDDGTPDGDED